MNLSISRFIRRVILVSAWCCLSTIAAAQENNLNVNVQLRAFLEGAIPEGVCGRTPQIQNKILELLKKSKCADITKVQLNSVIELDLPNSQISSLLPYDFGGLTKLINLNLHNNSLTNLPNEIFEELTSLQELHLSENELATTLTAMTFNGIANLEELYLQDNDGLRLEGPVFENLTKLRILNLGGARQLDTTNFSLPRGIFSNLTLLEELRLTNSNIHNPPMSIFQGLSNLKILDLSNNDLVGSVGNLEALSYSTFSGLPSLEFLNLTGNIVNETYCENLRSRLEDERTSVPVVRSGCIINICLTTNTDPVCTN